MHRLTMMAGALCVALLTSTGAFAQVPADPANPNETIPEAIEPAALWRADQSRDRQEGRRRGLAPKRPSESGMACASPSSARPAISSISRSTDNCQYASVTISQHKARTAARYRRPTLVFERLIGKGAFFAYLPTLDDVIASRGGNPLMVGGKVIGAIGVSGGTRLAGRRDLAGRRRGAQVELTS